MLRLEILSNDIEINVVIKEIKTNKMKVNIGFLISR